MAIIERLQMCIVNYMYMYIIFYLLLLKIPYETPLSLKDTRRTNNDIGPVAELFAEHRSPLSKADC